MCIFCEMALADGYVASVALGNDKISLSLTDGGAQIARLNYSWVRSPGNIPEVTYGFRASTPTYTSSNGDIKGTFSKVPTTEMAAIRSALEIWESIANIKFIEVNPGAYTDSATILFGNFSNPSKSSSFAYMPSSKNASYSSSQGDVWLNNFDGRFNNPSLQSEEQKRIIHEIGHSLGLSHPGDYNSTDGKISYETDAEFREDTRQYSIMSYWDATVLGANHTDTQYIDGSTPLLLDIIAIQKLYGANTKSSPGDDIYGFNATRGESYAFTPVTNSVFSIWDTDGNDTLDASGYRSNQIINLISGEFSDIGALTKNVSIAPGVIIENARGGSGNDTILGNSVDNYLHGNLGSDVITGGAGNDEINGGSGVDTAVFSGSLSQYSFSGKGASVNVKDSVLSRDGTDKIIDVEFLRFSDQTISTNLLPTYSVVASSTSVNEGSIAVFMLTTENVSIGTQVSYTLSGVSALDIQGGSLTGTVTVGSNGQAAINIALMADNLTEGVETLTVTAAGKTASTLIKDTSAGIPTYVLSTGTSSLNEGSVVTYTLTTTSVAVGVKVPYVLSGISALDVQGGSLSGMATIGSNGQATISVDVLADGVTEGAETLTVTAAGKTTSVTINDTSRGLYSNFNGTNGNDIIRISSGSNSGDGGEGSDTVQYQTVRSAASVAHSNGVITITKAGGTDRIVGIERIDFTDGDLIFDVTSANAPAAYRLYGGAFARTPDEGGFRFWASTLDANVSLRDVASQFIGSSEFIGRYGASLGNAAFVDALYQNVLSRGGDAGGVAHWNRMLDNKLQDRSDILVQFTQLPEFVGISTANISNGYWVV